MTLRLDVALAKRGLASSRSQAAEWIRGGRVTVDGVVQCKPSVLVPLDAVLAADAGEGFVSRAGIKLAHALDVFSVSPGGLCVLDVGASTGGFTDCLLRRGARKVWAVDVGHGQLAPSLRGDARVVLTEGVNARDLSPETLGGTADMAVIDVSFISQRLILPAVTGCLNGGAPIISLIKPQFEAGRGNVGKGGVVRDARIHARVTDELGAFAEGIGLKVLGTVESPIPGGDGNKEFLMYMVTDREVNTR
ncbi:MAG: TlyA family RNA methyltransferase [Oscillospiraceae bacterium]|jgi:23S rRNA (cytidine1920-2'-O)/16S rRNA (cytidine1409-2'-O)-methyltransferase|nr:TlyA family RNA methyltransferase [Oscillospiraceae bacterium]